MLGVVVVFALVVAIVGFADFNDVSDDKIALEEDFRVFTEEECNERDDEIICVESTYIDHNGEITKIPGITGYTVTEKVYVTDYIVIESNDKLYGDEKPSPADRIQDSDMTVYNDKIVIRIRDLNWRNYIDSNSMDPLIDEGTTTIEIKPKNTDEIKVGDIIAYDVDGYDYAFVHRVVEISQDGQGVYFITKGDNFYKKDPDKVRFSDVEGIVVGILY